MVDSCARLCAWLSIWLSSSENLLSHNYKHYKVRLSKDSSGEFYFIVLQGPQRSRFFSCLEIKGLLHVFSIQIFLSEHQHVGQDYQCAPWVCACTYW